MNQDGVDRNLGMSRPITRRDFLNGVGLTIGATMLPFEAIAREDVASEGWKQEPFLGRGITQDDVRYYPPALTGLRGSHPGSFEAAHQLRDGKHWDEATV